MVVLALTENDIGAFKLGTLYLASGVEAAAGLIIALGAIEATIRALVAYFTRRADEQLKENIRLRLGRWLALALEFETAADILRTAVAPTWNEIGQLAAIVILRTALNYFLQKEIDRSDQRRVPAPPACPAASPAAPADSATRAPA